MLACKHFRGCHKASLETVAYGEQAAEHGNHGLAGAYVALEEAVHLTSAHQVAADFLDDALLGAGELVGEGVVAGVEVLTYLGHRKTLYRAGTDVLLLEQGELEEEEFLELEAAPGSLQGFAVLREVYVYQCVTFAHEGVVTHHVFGQGLGDRVEVAVQRGGYDLAHHLSRDACVPELLAARIYGAEAGLALFHLGGSVDFRMDHIDAIAETLRLAEEDEDLARLELWP